MDAKIIERQIRRIFSACKDEEKINGQMKTLMRMDLPELAEPINFEDVRCIVITDQDDNIQALVSANGMYNKIGLKVRVIGNKQAEIDYTYGKRKVETHDR